MLVLLITILLFAGLAAARTLGQLNQRPTPRPPQPPLRALEGGLGRITPTPRWWAEAAVWWDDDPPDRHPRSLP